MEQGTESSKSSRTRRRRAQVREEILDMALRVVMRDGYEQFSLGTIAAELELTKPALYHYFRSKDALVLELVLREMFDSARAVQAAVETSSSGADAVEALMRSLFDRYRRDLDLFKLVYRFQRPGGMQKLVGPEELERLRPVNDMLYAGVEARLGADENCPAFPEERSARLFAFNAHMAALGILTMKAVVEEVDDPLLHSDEQLIEDMCRTFREACQQGGRPC